MQNDVTSKASLWLVLCTRLCAVERSYTMIVWKVIKWATMLKTANSRVAEHRRLLSLINCAYFERTVQATKNLSSPISMSEKQTNAKSR